MNDDNTEGPPEVGSPNRKRTVAVAAAVGVAGLVAGGLAAGGLSSASAESGSSTRTGYGAPQGYGARTPGDPSKPQRSDEKLLTGDTKAKVLAAVKTKYPKATIQRVETDSDGVYEAHIVNGGKPLTVELDKSFKIAGTETGPAGGGPGGGPGGRHGGPPGGGPSGSGGEQGRPPAPPSESGGPTA